MSKSKDIFFRNEQPRKKKVNCNRFHTGVPILISNNDAEAIFQRTLDAIQDDCMGRLSKDAYMAAKKYSYKKLGKDFEKSSEAVSKWFRLSRIPDAYKDQVMVTLSLTKDDITKKYRGDNE